MKIRMCGLPYNVEIVDSPLEVSHSQSGQHLYGEVSYAKSSIRIDGSKPIEQVNQALWHEILHTIIEGLNIRELMDENRNHHEIPIDQLALGINSVLMDQGITLLVRDPFGMIRSEKEMNFEEIQP